MARNQKVQEVPIAPVEDPIGVMAEIGRWCDDVSWVLGEVMGLIGRLNASHQGDVRFLLEYRNFDNRAAILLLATPYAEIERSPHIAFISFHDEWIEVRRDERNIHACRTREELMSALGTMMRLARADIGRMMMFSRIVAARESGVTESIVQEPIGESVPDVGESKPTEVEW